MSTEVLKEVSTKLDKIIELLGRLNHANTYVVNYYLATSANGTKKPTPTDGAAYQPYVSGRPSFVDLRSVSPGIGKVTGIQ